jgi:hypothetical protein
VSLILNSKDACEKYGIHEEICISEVYPSVVVSFLKSRKSTRLKWVWLLSHKGTIVSKTQMFGLGFRVIIMKDSFLWQSTSM